MISLNHNNIPKPVEAKPTTNVKSPYPCIDNTAPNVKFNNEKLTNIGHGDIVTKWNGKL